MRKVSQKTKFRVTFLTIGFIISIVIFGSTLFSYLSQINSNKNEIATLQKKYSEELELEEDYKNQINKLQDPEYVARRIREKHLYSGKNEIVIKIED
ncbi:MAG: septum formation initiator family protein [Tenericutes bacterium]|nr:septum formation initiator family protein [Mycoplasmatota bacterium]